MSVENISINDYMKTLNFDQLIRAREIADARINEINEEKKVTLFIVDNGLSNVACYKENDFDKAKIKVCELIMSNDFKRDDVRREHPKINIKKVASSEFGSWMSINT